MVMRIVSCCLITPIVQRVSNYELKTVANILFRKIMPRNAKDVEFMVFNTYMFRNKHALGLLPLLAALRLREACSSSADGIDGREVHAAKLGLVYATRKTPSFPFPASSVMSKRALISVLQDAWEACMRGGRKRPRRVHDDSETESSS
jgi:hypothetical protein